MKELKRVTDPTENMGWSGEETRDFNCANNAPFGKDYAAGNENLIVSKHIFVSPDDRKTHGSSHIMAFGGSGSGKTYNVIRPNLMRAFGSYIVADPLGNLLEDSRKKLEREGYQIKVLDFCNPAVSEHYNPLLYVRNDEDVTDIVNCILGNMKTDASVHDPFWGKTEAAILTAIFLYLLHFRPEADRTMGTALKMAVLAKDHIKDFDELFETAREKNANDSALMHYDIAKLASSKTELAARTAVAFCLSVFNGTKEENLSIDDSIHLDKVCDKKTAIFVTGFHLARKQAVLVPMLFMQAFTATAYHAAYECENCRGANFLTLLMDELPNLGYIPRLDQHLATCRKYGISAVMASQMESQLNALYLDAVPTILAACKAVVYMPGTSGSYHGDVAYITERLGTADGAATAQDTETTGKRFAKGPILTGPLRRVPQGMCLVCMRGMRIRMDEKYTD